MGFYERVKALKTLVDSLACPYITVQGPIEVYCRVLVADHFYDLHQPRNFYILFYTKCFACLEQFWSDDETKKTIEEDIRNMKPYIEESASCLGNRRLSKSS